MRFNKRLRKNAGKIVLFGGRKPVRVSEIKTTELIGEEGAEGEVYAVEAVIKRGKREKRLQLAQKDFTKSGPNYRWQPNARNAIKQFKTMRQLLKLNSEKKLGLHIIPTIRLMKGARHSLILTRLKGEVELSNLPVEERATVGKQMARENEILQRLGYTVHSDMWVCVREPKTGAVTAWIADFGNIAKIKH